MSRGQEIGCMGSGKGTGSSEQVIIESSTGQLAGMWLKSSTFGIAGGRIGKAVYD